jgi:hypothetical protein
MVKNKMYKRKKICFVMLTNIYLTPYFEKYLSTIDCDYDVIFWNRHNVEEKTSAQNQFVFNYSIDEGKSKLSKLIGYLKFRAFAKRILQKADYDGVIVFTTSAGILLKDVLRKNYKNKYIVDVRDYTLENNSLFLEYEKQLINNSFFTVISSKGYLKFLPYYDHYVLTHNNLTIDEKRLQRFRDKKKNGNAIVISYIGLIRFHDQNKRIIDTFGGDDRFIVRFIGKDAFALKEYCEQRMVKNVELIDWFPPEKTLDYYYETDIICNLYGNHTPLLDYALSNKLYYAALLHIPILVCPDTFMAEISTEYGFGYVFSFERENAKDELYNYYRNIDCNNFIEDCERFNKTVENDNQLFTKKLQGFVDQI